MDGRARSPNLTPRCEKIIMLKIIMYEISIIVKSKSGFSGRGRDQIIKEHLASLGLHRDPRVHSLEAPSTVFYICPGSLQGGRCYYGPKAEVLVYSRCSRQPQNRRRRLPVAVRKSRSTYKSQLPIQGYVQHILNLPPSRCGRNGLP